MLTLTSGRLCNLVWHVCRGHVRGQGMDQLVAWLVFFDSWRWKRMEGMASGLNAFRLTEPLAFQLAVSMAKLMLGRERWRSFERYRLLLLRGPLGRRAPLSHASTHALLFSGGLDVVSNADAGAATGGHGAMHSLQHFKRISQVCVVDRRSCAFLFAQCAVDRQA